MSLTYCQEAPYIAALAQHVRGLAEVALPVGRADVATATDVFEVEPFTRWRYGARQALAYAGMSGLRANLALFGAADYVPLYLRVRDNLPTLTLWVWHPELRWRKVTNRQEAARLVVA
jgi:hypothetical protein